MLRPFRLWLKDVPLADTLRREQAVLLQAFLFILIAATLVGTLSSLTAVSSMERLIAVSTSLLLGVVLSGAVVVLRRGHFTTAVALVLVSLVAMAVANMVPTGLEGSRAIFILLALPIVLAGLLGGRRILMLAFVLSVLAVVGVTVLENVAPTLVGYSEQTYDPVLTCVSFVVGAGVLTLLVGRFGQALQRALWQARSREQELEQLRDSLEVKVVERTTDLAQAVAVAQEARAAADEANQLKTRFLANMSHELRTPLNAILNFTDMLGLPRFGPLTERQQDLQQRVLANAEHLLGLINDILDLAKIEAGRMDLFYETVNLSTLLQSIMSTAIGLTKDKGLRLTLDAPHDLPPVWIDKTRVRQVLLNLLSNAAKFTDQGAITVRAHARPDGMVELAVQDTGIGIDPANQALIFEEFRQVQDANTRTYGGTGLGLPISKRLVAMHGGQMWMESTPGSGSTFVFTIPTTARPPKTSPSPEDIAAPYPLALQTADQPLVVVVDDDPDAQAILGQQLTSGGYAVQPVLDSRQALETVLRTQPRLVILDVQMPQLDGWAVLSQLRSTFATAAIPVIMCTIVDEQRLGVMLGASDFVLKPVRQEDFLARVQRWVDQPASVLIVDDDADARQILRTALETHGYQVREATNGAEALVALEDTRPALLVLDLMMPIMDGFEVLKRLDTDAAYRDMPVLVVSARDLSPEEAQWVRTRSCEYLQKGLVTNEQFLQHIHQCVHHTVEQ